MISLNDIVIFLKHSYDFINNVKYGNKITMKMIVIIVNPNSNQHLIYIFLQPNVQKTASLIKKKLIYQCNCMISTLSTKALDLGSRSQEEQEQITECMIELYSTRPHVAANCSKWEM